MCLQVKCERSKIPVNYMKKCPTKKYPIVHGLYCRARTIRIYRFCLSSKCLQGGWTIVWPASLSSMRPLRLKCELNILRSKGKSDEWPLTIKNWKTGLFKFRLLFKGSLKHIYFYKLLYSIHSCFIEYIKRKFLVLKSYSCTTVLVAMSL